MTPVVGSDPYSQPLPTGLRREPHRHQPVRPYRPAEGASRAACREVFTVLEYAAFLTASRAGTDHHAIAVLGGTLGLRASEMAGLTVNSVSTVRGYVMLTFVGNGDKPARVPGAPARLACGARGHRRPHQRTAIAHLYWRWHGAPLGAPLRRPHRPDGRDHLAYRAAALRRTSAPSGSSRAFRCATFSACRATPARRPPWPATTSAATPSSGTPPTQSSASLPAGPADPGEDEAHASPSHRRSPSNPRDDRQP